MRGHRGRAIWPAGRLRWAGGYRGAMLPPDVDHVDFDAVIDDVVERLPGPFREQLGSVAIVVDDEATPEQLAAVHAPGLFGLYQGVPRTRWGVDNVPLPSKITLFRGPLTRAHPGPARLTKAIEDTLLHEIAHHLGIDDARLRELATGRRHGHG
jgi:predicted Zn-dependent protease with MMP-like domain